MPTGVMARSRLINALLPRLEGEGHEEGGQSAARQ